MRERLKIPTGDVLEIIHQYEENQKQKAFQIIEEMEGKSIINFNKIWI